MARRKEFSAKVRDKAFARSGKRCESARVPQLSGIGCNRELRSGDIRYEHVDPDGLTGEPTLDNCAVICTACWRIKTDRYDLPMIAKAKRRERRHVGIRTPSRFPCSRDSQFKKKITGEVVRR